MYKMSPVDIAALTPYQQLVLCNPKAVADTIYFDTMEQFLEWQRTRAH